MVGKSSYSIFLVDGFSTLPVGFFVLIYYISFKSFSSGCYWQTLSNNFYLSLNYSIFLSIYSREDGANTFRLSNIDCTLNGMLNTFCYYFSSYFFFLIFLPFVGASSSYLVFLDLRIYTPFYFFHWESEAIFALISTT